MSDSEQMGRCRMEITAAYKRTSFRPKASDLLIADAIDRLAADVAAIKAKVEQVAPEDVRHFVEAEKAWVAMVEERAAAAIRERYEALAEVERLKRDGTQAPDDLGVLQDAHGLSERCKELASRIAMQQIEARAEKVKAELKQQPPTAPQPAAPPAGWWTAEDRETIDAMAALELFLSRASSPPVVEVPVMSPATYGFDSPFSSGEYRAGYRQACLTHRAAMDRAGVAWKEVGRE